VSFFLTYFIRFYHKKWLEKQCMLEPKLKHSIQNCSIGLMERLTMSLEMKWGIIKHDIVNSLTIMELFKHCKNSATSIEDTIQKVLQLYKSKHP